LRRSVDPGNDDFSFKLLEIERSLQSDIRDTLPPPNKRLSQRPVKPPPILPEFPTGVSRC
ncbi:MAG: hypothetical protein OXM87_07225, partial [Truepera sp.]|nr:hypothetical protein [Truepera sp.]